MNIFISDASEMGKGSPFYNVKKIVTYQLITLGDICFLKAEVEPPITGQPYGLGDFDPTTAYFADRVESSAREDSIKTLKKFPIYAHAFLVKRRNQTEVRSLEDLQNVSWVTLYDSEEAALKAIEHWERMRGERGQAQ